MKTLSSLCFALLLGAPLAAQTPTNVPLGTVRTVGSSHSTTPDGIQSWNSTSLLSPSGQWYAEDSYFGSDYPDGFSSVDVVLNEPGIWQVWHGYGYGAPQSSSTWSQLDEYLQVGPAANQAPSIAWTSTPGTAAQAQPYTISAHGHDDDGNLSQVNIWKNEQPFAFAGGGNGTDGDSGNTTSDNGPQTITFTAQAVDADGVLSPVVTHVITIAAPANTPPVVTLVAPAAQTVTAGTTLTITSHATDPDGNITSHNLDIQRPAGDWNFQGGFATGEPYQGGPVGIGADSTRSASFTFTDVGTYQVRSAANDGSGWVQSATVTITVVAPPPVQFSLVTTTGSGGTVSPGGTYNAGTVVSVTATPDGTHDFAGWSGDAAGSGNPVSLVIDGNKAVQANFSPKILYSFVTSASAGGAVSAGGTFNAGTVVTATATPDATHDFAGWSGDAAGSGNPVSLTLDRNKAVQASFSLKMFTLITSATTGGNVTPGGSYPYGTSVTVSATPDSTHSFIGWAGDASSTASSILLTLTSPFNVQAVFTDKTGQTIAFPSPGNQPVGTPAFTLTGSASSGLPISYTVLSGPAVVSGDQLTITGPGSVTVQASQPGDATYLPAPSVTQTFNAVATALLKYRPAGRTLLQADATTGIAPFVLEKP
ncbi:MAG: hypothetical protein RL091_2695 [Verrucomicrobiota bacterium]|jgi:hypothetical protein